MSRQLGTVLETCARQQTQVFQGGIWSGGAATAANGALARDIDQLTVIKSAAEDAIRWHNRIAGAIAEAKSAISDNVEIAGQAISALQNDPTLEADDRTTAINRVIATAYGANTGVVAATAEQIQGSAAGQVSPWPDSRDQTTPPPDRTTTDLAAPDRDYRDPGGGEPSAPGSATRDPGGGEPSAPGSSTRDPGGGEPSVPGSATRDPGGGEPSAPGSATRDPGGGERSAPGRGRDPFTREPGTPEQRTSAQTRSPAESTPDVAQPAFGGGIPAPLTPPSSSGSSPMAPRPEAETSGESKPAPAHGAAPASLGPSGGTETAGRGGGADKGLAAASVKGSPVAPSAGMPAGPTTPVPAPLSAEDPSAVTPGAAPMSPGAPGGAAAAGRGSTAPVGTRPAAASPPPGRNAPASGRKAPATPAAERKGRRQEQEPSERIAAAAAPIPVSAARAERDAIAAAIAPEAAKRSGVDPLAVARRVAAALNAPDSPGSDEFGFFWVTAVSADGAIVVANSYGLAYIPDGVQLPEPVQLATADAEIPAVDRARWATHPAMAVQGWAAHHNRTLRAVIATAEQFGSSDPGAAKVVLEPEDIPATGAMTGRSRLDVVDPDAAARLAETSDAGLLGLLPPAPAGSGALSDRLGELSWAMVRPLTTSAEGRESVHLNAFRPYAALLRDIALTEAHTTAESDARRSAVADWLYWRHLGELLDTALGGTR